MKFRNIYALSFAIAAILISGAAAAATTTGSFNATATVPGSCKIVSHESVALGNYDATGIHGTGGVTLSGSGSISVLCTAGAIGVRIGMNNGSNGVPGSTDQIPSRRMRSGSNYLEYQIHRINNATQSWSMTVGEQLSLPTFTSSVVPVVVPMYVFVPQGQNAPLGSYSDSVTAVVTF
jgi:spore coat protein U-like protein